MAYSFTDRLKEWTSYAGVAVAALGTALPPNLPVDSHWAAAWQAAYMLVAGALFFIPQTAGTTAVENDAWSLLRAFAKSAPPQYSDAMKPLLAELASHLAKAEADSAVPAATAVKLPAQPQPVYATLVLNPQQITSAATLVADPAHAINPPA